MGVALHCHCQRPTFHHVHACMHVCMCVCTCVPRGRCRGCTGRSSRSQPAGSCERANVTKYERGPSTVEYSLVDVYSSCTCIEKSDMTPCAEAKLNNRLTSETTSHPACPVITSTRPPLIHVRHTTRPSLIHVHHTSKPPLIHVHHTPPDHRSSTFALTH